MNGRNNGKGEDALRKGRLGPADQCYGTETGAAKGDVICGIHCS